MAFLRWRARPWGFAVGLARLAPAVLAYLVRRDRGALKSAAVGVFLAGLTEQELRASAEAFADCASPALLRPDALERWRTWRDGGARLVIVTASPEILVEPFARRLGADMTIGTRLAADAEDRITGALAGLNCRGAEKVARLEAVFGAPLRLAAAYGDTAGDREMLGIADEAGYRVFTK